MTPRGDVATIRAQLADPRAVAALLGLKATPHSRGVFVVCPAHGDRGPSCSLTVGADKTLRVHCFACPFAGDVITLIAACRNLTLPRDFKETLTEAAALASMPVPEFAAYRPPPPRASDEAFRAVCASLLRCRLPRDAEAYLHRRGILREARADGWTALPRMHGQGELTASLLARFGEATLLGTGLWLAQDDGLVRFIRPGARLLIPYRDEAGEVYSIQRRRLDAGEPKYVACAGRPLALPYGVERVRASPGVPLVYVEGAVDVLSVRALLARAGRRAVVLGLPGVETWVRAWARWARNRPAYVGTDANRAGEGAVQSMMYDLLVSRALRVERWRPPGDDWTARA